MKKRIKVKEFLMAEGTAAHGWAARDASGHLSPFNFSRRYYYSSLTATDWTYMEEPVIFA